MNRRCLLFATAFAFWLATAAPAAAQEFPSQTDRDYALDIYSGNALGSLEIVSMGGAAVAVARGSAGMIINPAAPAVRSQTSTGKWDWDAHVDWLGAVAGNDFDNNGVEDDSFTDLSPQVTFGASGNYKQWALGVTFTGLQFEARSPGGDKLNQTSLTALIHLARSFFGEQLIVGAGFKPTRFAVEDQIAGELFVLTSTAVEAGAIWAPANRNLRVGAAASLPAVGETVEVEACDPLDCSGLILPNRFEVPWHVTAGVGLRRAPTRWNRKVKARFVDEKQLIVALDVKLTGAVRNGHGVGQFAQGRLQRSGKKVVFSGRAGAEYTWFPGRFRIRGGSYWEPPRFEDADGQSVPGRVHITAGADLRVWQFRIWKRDYRVRLSFTFDGAEQYVNSGVSIGFWR